jgi:hypothetical protein
LSVNRIGLCDNTEDKGGSVTVVQHIPVTVPEQPAKRLREAQTSQQPEWKPARSTNVDQVLNDSFPASDPPSWTGAISRVARDAHRHESNDRLSGAD